jgi:hypothetical protein
MYSWPWTIALTFEINQSVPKQQDEAMATLENQGVVAGLDARAPAVASENMLRRT